MVRLYDRPVTPREAEGRIQTAELLKWLQYSKYVPTTCESRLLQVGIDELFSRTIDMTTLSVAFSVRLWTGWMKLRFTKRWLVPVYAGLVVADRRRALNMMKSDSTYATLVALSQLDSPMGREAKRLVDKSTPRLEKFKVEQAAANRRSELQMQRYLRQIFCFYGYFGPTIGAVLSHVCLWTTIHETFEGSAFMHSYLKSSSSVVEDGVGDELGEFSIAHELQQQQILEAVEKKRLQDQQQNSSGKNQNPTPSSAAGWVKTKGLTNEEASKKIQELHAKQKQQQKSATTTKQPQIVASKVFLNLQMNFRWYKWQVLEVSSVVMDEGSTLAFSVSTPLQDSRNDFIANELRKCGSAATLNWWYPARLWWSLRWMSVSKNPPAPIVSNE
jgi:hypothetical protein